MSIPKWYHADSLRKVEGFVRLRNPMADTDIPRTIRLPAKLWDAVDREAVRCKRSSVKQIEAVLMTYYGLEDTAIDRTRLVRVPMEGEITDELQSRNDSKKATPSRKRASKAAR